MLKLDLAEFNITNVCNLNCDNCISFNNYSFKGHQLWQDYESIYHLWKELIDIDHIRIVGGEPTLNPSFEKWVFGLRACWPNARITVATNGTQLFNTPYLYTLLQKCKVDLFISAHGIENRKKIIADLQAMLTAPLEFKFEYAPEELSSWINAYNAIADREWPNCDHPNDFINLPVDIQQECIDQHGFSQEVWQDRCWRMYVEDGNKVEIKIDLTNRFQASAITAHGQLHSSDPTKAIAVCCARYYGTFYQGQLYKCSTTAVLPEFIKQFDLDITDHQRSLITSYQPANVTWSQEELEHFVENIVKGSMISQCTLCPEDNTFGDEFEAGRKKIKFYSKGRASQLVMAPVLKTVER